MAEIIEKNQGNRMQFKLHKFESKCLQKCLFFQSKLNLKQPLTSTLGFPKVRSISYLKNQNPQLFDEKSDWIGDLDQASNKIGTDGFNNIPLNKQCFPINLYKFKQNEFFSDKVSFLLEIDLDSKKNEDLNSFKFISVDYAKLTFELLINGKCHEMKLFETDLRVQIEGFHLIKAIQSRLENYKKEIFNKGYRQQKNEFLSFILDNNFHLRFLFTCPNRICNLEKYQTNVNNIMNTGFLITKLFIEFYVPISKFSESSRESPEYSIINDINQYNEFNLNREFFHEKFRNRKSSGQFNKGYDYNNVSLSMNKFDITNKFKTGDKKQRDNNRNHYNVLTNTNQPDEINDFPNSNNMYNNSFKSNNLHYFTQQPSLYQQNYPLIYSNNVNNCYYGNYYVNNNYFNNNYAQNLFIQYNNNYIINNLNLYANDRNARTNIKDNDMKNISNWHVFMTNSTPLIYDSDEVSLKDFWSFYDKSSVLGVDCIFKSKGQRILTNYLPTLSSMYVEITNNNSDQINSSFSSISSKKTDHNNNINTESQTTKILSNFRNQTNNYNNIPVNNSNFDAMTYHSNSTNESLFLDDDSFLFEKLKKSDNTTSVISFTEDQMIYNRTTLKEKIEDLFKKYPELETAMLGDVSEHSYFSLLWTPIKSLNYVQNTTSFLVYYKFRNKQFSNSIKYLPVTGIVSNNRDDDFWFTNQMLLEAGLMNEMILSVLTEDFIRNRYQFYQYSESLQKLIVLKKVNSIDYNFLIK